MYSGNMEKIIKAINSAQSGYEAANRLVESAESGLCEMKSGVLFKCGEYFIQNIFKTNGSEYEANIRLLASFNLSVLPEYIETIIKDNDMFIITKIEGCNNGDLKEYSKIKEAVSEENKNKAFEDLTKLIKQGYTDDKIFFSHDLWYVSPEKNEIILPSFEALRKVEDGEEEIIMKECRRILF